jgi:hypothetical protein
MKHVICTLTCRVLDCLQELVLDTDHLPPGWWKDDHGREVCPRHRVRVEAVTRLPEDDIAEALAEHARRGYADV